jgi:hypothetical protein
MVIIVIYNVCITINKLKKNSPIAGYLNCIKSLFIAAQLMKEGARVIHILYFICGIETIEDSFKPFCMFRLYSFLAPCEEKFLNAFMFKGFYHNAKCNL